MKRSQKTYFRWWPIQCWVVWRIKASETMEVSLIICIIESVIILSRCISPFKSMSFTPINLQNFYRWANWKHLNVNFFLRALTILCFGILNTEEKGKADQWIMCFIMLYFIFVIEQQILYLIILYKTALHKNSYK